MLSDKLLSILWKKCESPDQVQWQWPIQNFKHSHVFGDRSASDQVLYTLPDWNAQFILGKEFSIYVQKQILSA